MCNAIMGSVRKNSVMRCYRCGETRKLSSDHIGPISLGFIHDPLNIVCVCTECNSQKNNRITESDVSKLLQKEKDGDFVASWWATHVWNKYKSENVSTLQKHMLYNSHNFLEIINYLKCELPMFFEDYHTLRILPQLNKKYNANVVICDDGAIKYQCDINDSYARTKHKQDNRIKEILASPSQKKRTHKYTISQTQLHDMFTNIATNYSFNSAIDIICKTLQMLSCQRDT
jgi:hypothetical protein